MTAPDSLNTTANGALWALICATPHSARAYSLGGKSGRFLADRRGICINFLD